MDFDLTEEQNNIIESFTNFSRKWFDKNNLAQWQNDQGLPDDVCQAFVNLYCKFIPLDISHAHSEITLSQVLILETLARCSGTTLPFYSDMLSLRIIQQFSNQQQFMPILSNYRKTGRLPFALAITEPSAGSDTMGMKCCVQTVDGQLTLNGQKTFVVNGEYAPHLMVVAIDKDSRSKDKYPALSFWLLPRNLPGIRAYPVAKIGQNMLPFANLVFEDVPLKEEYRLHSEVRAGFPQLFHLFEIGRIMVCAESLGLANAAMDDAVRYAKKRKEFGHYISEFQQIDQMIVDMQVKIDNMRSMTYKAAWDIDKRSPRRRLSTALAKRYVPRAATEVASDALQILGGRGYTEDERVSWIWRDCRGNQISLGTDQIMVRIATPLILDSYNDEDSYTE